MSGLVFQQLPFLSHHCCSVSKNGSFTDSPVAYPKFPSYRFLSHAASSSSASVGGSESWLDSNTRQKKKRIAGIDQDELLDPKLLGDPDSSFCEFNGVHIHHKVVHGGAESEEIQNLSQHSDNVGFGFPIILLHGFGASVFSWNRVMKRLADVTASKVLAFDRPAFGLTSRVDSSDAKPLNPYSMAFSVLATLYFIDFLAAKKAILVGHSAGSLVAVNSYFEAPERVAALILVAPAIVAPRAIPKVAERNEAGRESQTEGDQPSSSIIKNQILKIFKIISYVAASIARVLMKMVKGMSDMLKSSYKKVLSTILRSTLGVMLIRMIIDKFGIAAVRTAWHDSRKVDEHVLDGYTKPLRTKGWDKALAEFTAATLASPESESKPPLSKRLHEISCPVLIITGDNDRIVPSWNAKRLSQAIPGSCLEIIKHCGHLPHEEKVEEFVSIVDMFLRRAFGDSMKPALQVSN